MTFKTPLRITTLIYTKTIRSTKNSRCLGKIDNHNYILSDITIMYEYIAITLDIVIKKILRTYNNMLLVGLRVNFMILV